MRVHKAAGGALVRAQRTEQTISLTLHARSVTRASVYVRPRVCMPCPCAGVRSYCSGRDGRVTYVTLASLPCVRVPARARAHAYTRTSRARAHPLRGVCTAVDSLGPEDISQRGRRRSRSNPEGCSFSQPSGSLSSLPPPSAPSSPLRTGWGRRRKLLLCSTFAGNDPATRMRPSLFPFILVPVSDER